MSILPLVALPAATQVARDAVAGTTQVGKSFINLIAQWGQSPAAGAAANSATESSLETLDANPLERRTASFSERLAKWLRQQPWLRSEAGNEAPLSLELSLDALDRPRATLGGQPSNELNNALARDPSWLQEFRELALDRIEQHGAFDTTSPPQSLTIEQQSATMDPQYRWDS